MRRSLLIALVVLLGTPAAAQACGARKGHTVASNAHVRAYWTGHRYDPRYYACLRPRGRPLEIWRGAMTDGFPEDFHVAGRFLSYWWSFDDRYTDEMDLFVHRVDLRRSRIREWRFGYCLCSSRGTAALHGMRLMRSGVLAFMVGPVDKGLYEVWARGRAVDSGTDIDPASFRAAPGGVRWIRGGVERTVALR